MHTTTVVATVPWAHMGTQTVPFADIEMGFVFSEDLSSLISYCNPKQTLKEA